MISGEAVQGDEGPAAGWARRAVLDVVHGAAAGLHEGHEPSLTQADVCRPAGAGIEVSSIEYKERHRMSTDEVKGRIKEAAGDLTDDDDLKSEGKLDKAAGKVKDAVDDVKDKLTGKS